MPDCPAPDALPARFDLEHPSHGFRLAALDSRRFFDVRRAGPHRTMEYSLEHRRFAWAQTRIADRRCCRNRQMTEPSANALPGPPRMSIARLRASSPQI